MTPLVDIGANLVKDRFDLPQVLAEASRAGVGSIMITGTSISASKDAQKLVAQWSEPSAKATEACGFSDSPHALCTIQWDAIHTMPRISAEMVAYGN